MQRKSRGALIALAIAPLFTGFDCGGSGGGPNVGVVANDVSWSAGNVIVAVRANPFGLAITDNAGKVLVETAPLDDSLDAADPMRAYAPLAITHDTDTSPPTIEYGWSYFRGDDDPWHHAVVASSIDVAADHLAVHLSTSLGTYPGVTLEFTPQGIGVHLVATVDSDDPNAADTVNRVSLGFILHDDDHFMGMGERFVQADHRGQMLYNWVEDGGFGHGESEPVGENNPSPSGPGETNIPIPWFMNPRGFGMLLNTTYRTNLHFGEERPDAWRVEAMTGTLDATIFASPDPNALVEALTEITGRPPAIADWVLAPRRRGDPGSTESAQLRAAHIPTSVIDADPHYFPNGAGVDHASMKSITADLHARGFKAVSYFCPFVDDQWHPVFDDAAANGYLVKKADGTPYVVLDPPRNAAMVDFTNPAAVAWYQSKMQEAIDDGWDGWMYDFAEYVPQDAVFANGKTGMEMHNQYPLLYQQAVFDLFEKQKPGDYLIFVRSGYAGTGGKVPMVWAGDQSTDFDMADGLPAALCGALNAGMSGIPLWGSDISGYHFVFNPPPDKEVYLRWTEVGAFSADMHDENQGAGSFQGATDADRWQIWKDQESQDVYKKYATVKTRMLPYVRVAVREAREHGTPVMRHLYLTSPQDPNVYSMQDEYFYGDSLLVAPVVTRGLTSRSVYLPDPQYFDYWTGLRVQGGGPVNVSAPLDVVPVFAKVGAIVPMLAPDVETVVPSSDGSVVSMQDRADFLEVQVFAGGTTTLTLDDGTTFAQTAPTTAFAIPAPTHGGVAIPKAATQAELQTCAACYWDDASVTNAFQIAVQATSDDIVAGPLALSVKGSPSVKRFLFSVRH